MPEEIQGMDDLLKDLEELSDLQAQQVLSKTMKNASIVLAEEQEHLVPQKTGKLASSIRYQITEKTASEVFSRIGPTRRAFYASFGNWGTRHQQGQHFIERAFENKKDEIWAIIRFELGAFIDKTMRKSQFS